MCVCACVRACMWVRAYLFVCICLGLCADIHDVEHVRAGVYVCVCVCRCERVCVHIYI